MLLEAIRFWVELSTTPGDLKWAKAVMENITLFSKEECKLDNIRAIATLLHDFSKYIT
jgi:hypothetical protein